MSAGQLATVFMLASGSLGLLAGIVAHMPGDGLLLGLVHAAIPAALILDEAA
jgi:hypothetical protein